MSREEPVIKSVRAAQPGSMPAFLIARTASGEVRNFKSAAAPAGFLARIMHDDNNFATTVA
jgi:hypothetical protein